ncbi:MAG: hypothetical protein V1798_00780 [Pseudomonadota bacterium]
MLLESFGRFWAAWPSGRRKAKQAAERAWLKIAPNDKLVAAILAHVEASAATFDWRKDGGAFVPYPATYLNGRRWEDEIEVAGGGEPATLTPEEQREALKAFEAKGEVGTCHVLDGHPFTKTAAANTIEDLAREQGLEPIEEEEPGYV